MTTILLFGTCQVWSMKQPILSGLPILFPLLLHNWHYHQMKLDALALAQQVCLIDNLCSQLISLPACQLGPKKKQADAGIRPLFNPSHLPSVVVEVGSSESMTQLKIDAQLWLEHSAEVSQFVLYCHLLTWTSSDKACHPYFNRPPHSSLPKFSKTHHSIVAEFPPWSSTPSTHCISAKSSLPSLGSWLDIHPNTILHLTFWHLQGTTTCSLWSSWSCIFGYNSLAGGYY